MLKQEIAKISLIILAVIAILSVVGAVTLFITSAKAQTSYYGNQYRVTLTYGAAGSEMGDMNDATDKCSMRFTAQNTEAVTKIGVRIANVNGTSPSYRYGLQGDNPDIPGTPSGIWLAYGDAAFTSSGAKTITLTEYASLTAGTVYHLVVEALAASPPDGTNYIELGQVDPSNQLYPYDSSADTNANTLDYNITTPTTWEVHNKSPIYWLFNATDFYEGNPYYTYAGDDVYGSGASGNYCGEKFTVSGGNKSITTIGTLIKQEDTDEPADALYYHLYDVTTETIFIVSGTLCTAAETGTTYAWFDATLAAAQTLTNGNTYSLYFTSPNSVAGANYDVDKVDGYDAYKAQSYDGATNAYYISTIDSGSTWNSVDDDDIPFRFTLGGGVIKIIIQKWRELYH